MLVNISQFPGVFASLFTSGRLVHGTTLLGNRWHMRQDPARANTEWAWRWNCTLRWHRNHFGGCRYAVRNQPPEMPATQPVTIKMPLAVTLWSTHPHFAVHNRLNFAGGVQQAASSSTMTVRPVAVTVLLPQGMTPMGPIGQAAAPCVSDSAPVSDDRPGRLIQSAPCVSDSAPAIFFVTSLGS
jgi:hypothetical protein